MTALASASERPELTSTSTYHGAEAVGGQIPVPGKQEIVVSLERLDKVRAVDPLGNSMVVEAGMPLAAVHAAAEAVDRIFPLTLASLGSCQIGDLPAFLDEAMTAVRAAFPGCRPVPFGHMGDGNIHFNVSQPEGGDRQAFLDRWDEMNAVVHAVVRKYDGSVAAEHGVGRLKVDLLAEVKPSLDLELMGRLKDALDPEGILNPGRVIRRP